MSNNNEPNPPSRKQESFPKTTTIPEGWNGEALMAANNSAMVVPDTGSDRVQAVSRPAPNVDEELFGRRLDPFPKPNTIPNGWDLSEIYS